MRDRREPTNHGLVSPEELGQSIDAYVRLLDEKCSEAKLHAFLDSHPFFFHGIARHHVPIFSKVKLGPTYVTDFAFYDPSSYGVEWYFVEIESPAQKMFTKRGDMTAELTHAIGQVRDWHTWIHNNLAYARTIMPLVEFPFAYVFIGRRADLTENTRQKLRRLNFDNRGWMEIGTLDRLAEMAESARFILSQELQIETYSYADLIRGVPRESLESLVSDHAAAYKARRKHELIEERNAGSVKDFTAE